MVWPLCFFKTAIKYSFHKYTLSIKKLQCSYFTGHFLECKNSKIASLFILFS